MYPPDPQLPWGGSVPQGGGGSPTRGGGPLYLGVGLDDVALDLVHGVRPVGHRPQVETLEDHLVLGQSAYGFRSETFQG